MTKCKNTTCDKEVVSIEGRRPKEFCSVECRTKFHNGKKAKGTGRGRPKGSKNKPTTSIGVLKEAIQNMGNEPVAVNNGVEDIHYEEILNEAMTDENKAAIQSSTNDLMTLGISVTKTELVDGKVKITNELDKPKWDFSKVVFLNIEEFTEYPKNQCPPNGFQRTEYLVKKKEADDKIRESFRLYKK
jgi:hypothetical protein